MPVDLDRSQLGIYFVDVGQGDCTVIVPPADDCAPILFDCADAFVARWVAISRWSVRLRSTSRGKLLRGNPEADMLIADPRPGEPFAEECATFRELLPDLLREHEGEYAVIHRRSLLGTAPSAVKGLELGIASVGPAEVLIRPISRDPSVRPVAVVCRT